MLVHTRDGIFAEISVLIFAEFIFLVSGNQFSKNRREKKKRTRDKIQNTLIKKNILLSHSSHMNTINSLVDTIQYNTKR